MSLARKLSIALGVASIVVPGAWAYFEVSEFSSMTEAARLEGRYVCGLGAFAIMIITAASSGLLSGLGFVSGLAAYISLPRPRALPRVLELALLALPLVASAGFFALLVLDG
jgi:hypothetical protein